MSERAIISEAATAAVVVFALRLPPPQTYRLAQELLKIRQIFWVQHICLSRLCCVRAISGEKSAVPPCHAAVYLLPTYRIVAVRPGQGRADHVPRPSHPIALPPINHLAAAAAAVAGRGGPQIQGISRERFPGCVKLGEKVAFCLPTATKKTQFFNLVLTQPGAHFLGHPCTRWDQWSYAHIP